LGLSLSLDYEEVADFLVETSLTNSIWLLAWHTFRTGTIASAMLCIRIWERSMFLWRTSSCSPHKLDRIVLQRRSFFRSI